jgi:hypothetical protein
MFSLSPNPSVYSVSEVTIVTNWCRISFIHSIYDHLQYIVT